jgi:replicative DNA helicase
MARPDAHRRTGHAEFDPADITRDQYRWVWHAVDEIRQTLTRGEIRWQAVDRQLQAWRADRLHPDRAARTRTSSSAVRPRPAPDPRPWYAAKITEQPSPPASPTEPTMRSSAAAPRPSTPTTTSPRSSRLDDVVRASEQAEPPRSATLLSDS